VDRRAALAFLASAAALLPRAASADEKEPFRFEGCGVKTSCIPAPPNGEPRYIMPGAAYDPAKLAEERLKAKLAVAKQPAPPAPAAAE